MTYAQAMRAFLLGLVIAAAVAAPAGAAPLDSFQVATYASSRIWNQASWIPFAIDSPPGRVHVLRHAGRSFRGVWVPATIGGGSTSALLRYAWTLRRSDPAVLADRPLSAREQRRFVLLADLYRDADVLVVARDHPACAGLSRAQARAIVRGGITRWSQVAPGARADAIAVRYPSTGGDQGAESHFGLVRPSRRWARMPYAPGAKGATDGGVGAAAAGDHAVAAVSMWSRVRRFGTSVCAVPLDGVAPTDASVTQLSYPEAFPVGFYRPRKRLEAFSAAEFAALTAFFATEPFKVRLRGMGVLLPGDPVAQS